MIEYIKNWAEEYGSNKRGMSYICGLCALVLFLSLQSHAGRSDGIDYAFGIKQGSSLFHPHHVLYTALGFVVHRALSHVVPIDPLTLINILSSLVTAFTVALFFRLLMVLTKAESLSLLMTAFYTFNYSTLYMGTTAEVYSYSVLCELFALLLCVKHPRPSWPVLCQVAVLGALAVLFHQSAIFFVLALVVFIGLRARSIRAAAVVAAVSGLVTLAFYVFAAEQNGVRAPSGFVHWIFFYAHSHQYEAGVWGGGLTLAHAPDLLDGIFSTLVKPDWQKYMISQRLFVEWTDFVLVPAVAVLAGALVILLLYLLKHRKTVAAQARAQTAPLRVMLLVWITTGGLFVAWWDQTNIEFWYMLVTPLLLLLALRLHTHLRQGVQLPRSLRFIAVSLLFANLAGRVFADARPSRSMVGEVVAAIGCERIANGDLIIGPIWDLPPAIRYRCDKEISHASIYLAPPAEKKSALRRYEQLLFANPPHVYFLETELVPAVRNAYFESSWPQVEVESFYQPLLKDARLVGHFNVLGTTYKIHELAAPASQSDQHEARTRNSDLLPPVHRK
jgi:hypothetical protein